MGNFIIYNIKTKAGQTLCKKNFNHTKKLKFAKFTQMSQLWGEGKKQKKMKK